MNFLNTLLMMNPDGDQSPVSMLVFFGLMILVFYFFMIRPQVKKQKELSKFRNELEKGDKIVTTGGIYGKVSEIKDQIIIMDIGENVKIKIDKNAVIKDASDLAQQR